MHVLNRITGFIRKAVGFAFAVRRRRLTVAVVIAALLVGPLALTGDVELFALNAVGIGIAVLALRRLARFGRRRRHGDR